MEPKPAASVRAIFPYHSLITSNSKASQSNSAAAVPEDGSRKRRRHRSSHLFDSEQDFAVPSAFYIPPRSSVTNQPCLANLTNDVGQEVLDNVAKLMDAEDFTIKDPEFFHRRERELRREVFACGYRIQHFYLLRARFVEMLEKLRTDYAAANPDGVMADGEDAPEGSVRLNSSFQMRESNATVQGKAK